MAWDKDRIRGLILTIGPGIIWAGAAVGVSHIVQSTRAGAVYGWGLLWAVLVANIFKYPAFEFGPRYAAATGESLIEGYNRLGRWVLGLYLILTLLTMYTIQAGVTVAAAVMLNAVLGEAAPSLPMTASLILLVCAGLLALGNYPLLDKAMKIIMVLLTVSTIAAWAVTLGLDRQPVEGFKAPNPFDAASIMFLVALMGWMPSAIDISVWNSLWTLERARETGHKPTVSESLFDFNLGYLVTGILALFFLGLGANVIYGSGEEIKDGAPFGVQLFGMYTKALGSWAYPIIATAAITTMFSTAMTCFDAFPRVLSRSAALLTGHRAEVRSERHYYWIFLAALFVGTAVILFGFLKSVKGLVDFATTMSFMTAPVLAIINHWLITSRHTPAEHQPPLWMRMLSIAGIVFLLGFCALYVKVRFFS
ncbi:divalent metal cation transporter [bacterium]|nr:divalent metal cation transporter [bacterium]